MPPRPSGLPDFKNPPVSEVVLGLQFNSIAGFLAPHLGLVWEAYKDQFPHLEEHAPLNPVFETFGLGLAPPSLQLELVNKPDMPRVFFINPDRTQLLQVQRDRFVHNWRKIGDADSYPRFENMIETFQKGFERLEKTLAGLDLGPIVPNQCEVHYINQIEIPEGKTVYGVLCDIFGDFWVNLRGDEIGEPEDATVAFRYVIRDGERPIGRVSVQTTPARRNDGVSIIQMTLTARGAPSPEDMRGVRHFLEIGRERIVRTFTRLTTGAMHKTWGRTQ